MNTRLLSCVTALFTWCSVGAGEEVSVPELGNVMFVGDSITHGFNAPSYRWPLHKTLVDNGVRFVAVGVHEGNTFRTGSVAPGTPYAGVPFSNRHSAMSSERAYEISGRINVSGRLGNSNIYDWLGIDGTYTGKHRLDMPAQTPDTVVMMIGTNDTFGDYGSRGGIGFGDNMREAQKNLIGTEHADGIWSGKGDLDVIVDALRQVNPQVRVLLLTIPTWHDARRNNNSAADFAALAEYNAALVRWAAFKGLQVADVNRVLVNPARTDKPGVAEEQYFHPADRLHPTPQGDLLIAETVAQALGCPGRTAGLPRRSSADFEWVGAVEQVKGDSVWVISESERQRSAEGFTLTVQAQVGDGARNGWVQDKGLEVCCTVAEGRVSGHLTVSESAVLWQNQQVLYSGDMSANTEEIRIVWHPGKADSDIPQGFYVWLGQRLIGEALPAAAEDGATGGVRVVRRVADVPVNVQQLRAAPGSFAPQAR